MAVISFPYLLFHQILVDIDLNDQSKAFTTLIDDKKDNKHNKPTNRVISLRKQTSSPVNKRGLYRLPECRTKTGRTWSQGI